MNSLNPSLKLLRVLAGEGNFHVYRLLRERRLFLFVKFLLITFACFWARGSETNTRSIAFVKGANQLRYFRYAKVQLGIELGPLQLYSAGPMEAATDALHLPSISLQDFVHQVACLSMLLLTGSRRYVNLYLLAFASSMRKAVDTSWSNIESFVCFNDQPYDVAAILYALNERPSCRTIVIQHGLILSQNFYFPSVAKEFWAWGELSRRYYRAWYKDAKFVVKGRYADDAKNKAPYFVWPTADHPIRILVATSFFHDEVKQVLTELDLAMDTSLKATAHVAIKFHPATKLLWRLRRWCRHHVSWIKEEHEPMELLANRYDILVTKNSTSAIDFLLRGKPVLSSELAINKFPSSDFAFSIGDLGKLSCNELYRGLGKNQARSKFLSAAINV